MADCLAGQWVVETACSSVLVDGVAYQDVGFEVRNIFPNPYYPIYIILAVPVATSDPQGVCRAARSEAPETWATYIEPSNGHIVWGEAYENSSTLFPGESLGGFVLALPREQSCCFDFYFSGPFEPFAQERVCFECDAAVPVIRRTWGAVKTMYR
jgi:hypothetical protein